MRSLGSSGVWEVFLPGLRPGAKYKFAIRDARGDETLKVDPFAFRAEVRPANASVVHDLGAYAWNDDEWLRDRARRDPYRTPMSVYEMHLGSWRRHHPDGRWYTYRELADPLIAYLHETGFTHVEFMPVMEHPLDASWGYQVTGYFAPTARYGEPDDLKHLIDRLHQAGIGVILDWVPAHFPRDEWALARFDGTALYEHEDPRQGAHPDWGTLIFNYGRREVRNFLLSSALFWLEEYHADGLRTDAVASMLYLDYSRAPGEWVPNVHGGRENLDAIRFVRDSNKAIYRGHPGVVTAAEESTAWPGVSRPVHLGGLGFGFKWNMGWMHDVLQYFRKDPVHRRYHHGTLTFAMYYAFHENFVLSLSHDEVVHRKRSLLRKMPGDDWQRFANLRALYGYMWTNPGKKLLFMGGEFGQRREWSPEREIDWHLLDQGWHEALRRYVADLNRLYRDERALHDLDCDPRGFEWIDYHDADTSVLAYIRRAEDADDLVVCVFNLTPVPRWDYRVGVPRPGFYREILNSDAEAYGGSNMGNAGGEWATQEDRPRHGRPWSVALLLPPLSALVLRPDR
jgi:1,4-alpha-glucan branching enzyme